MLAIETKLSNLRAETGQGAKENSQSMLLLYGKIPVAIRVRLLENFTVIAEHAQTVDTRPRLLKLENAS